MSIGDAAAAGTKEGGDVIVQEAAEETKEAVDGGGDVEQPVSFGVSDSPVFVTAADASPDDNDMMKNLLSLSDNCQESGAEVDLDNDVTVVEDGGVADADDDDDDSDVVVESFGEENSLILDEPTNDVNHVSCAVNDKTEVIFNNVKDFSSFYREFDDNAEYGTFNYDVIVNFVQEAWDVVKKELKTGGAKSTSVLYYSS